MNDLEQVTLGEIWRKLEDIQERLTAFLLKETHEAEYNGLAGRIKTIEEDLSDSRAFQRNTMLAVVGQLVVMLSAIIWYVVTHDGVSS